MTPARAVELSLFPELQPDKPVGPILPSVFTGTNAGLMKAVAPFYLKGSVMDCTYGKGAWWTEFTPDPFVTHDLHKGDGVDYTDLPESDDTYDSVIFDPPYIAAGGVASTVNAAKFRDSYGLSTRTLSDLDLMNERGVRECARVVKPGGFVLNKCSDFVAASTLEMGHIKMVRWFEAAGMRCHDLIVHNTGSGPGGHNIFTPIRARRHHSYLLVFTSGSTSRRDSQRRAAS